MKQEKERTVKNYSKHTWKANHNTKERARGQYQRSGPYKQPDSETGRDREGERDNDRELYNNNY
eukprot:214930-Pyramimonas_sp.AAC.1